MEIFTEIESTINSMFEAIIQSAKNRKIKLLKEVNKLRNEWVKRREEILSSIQELEEKVSKINAMTVEQGRSSQILQNRLISINLESEELQQNTSEPQYQVKDTANQIIQLIETTGNIIKVARKVTKDINHYEIMDIPPEVPNSSSQTVGRKIPPIPPVKFKKPITPVITKYDDSISYQNLTDVCTLVPKTPETPPQEKKIAPKPPKTFGQNKVITAPKNVPDISTFQGRKKPILSLGKRGNKVGQLTQPRGIHFEEKTQHIYVVSRELRKVVVFNATGEFVSEFGSGDLEGPSGVVAQFGICFVTDEKLNGVLKYRRADCSLLDRYIFKRGIEPGEFKSLKSIAIDSGNVYIVDTGNNQVCILAMDFRVKSTLGSGILQQPQDIAIRDIVYVLDLESSSCVHMFTKECEHLTSILCTSELGMDMCIPNYFCVTQDGIIIVSFLYGSTLKVFSNEGSLIQEIGQKKITKETLTNCQGVCVTADNRVVCAFTEGYTCINIY